VFAVVAVVASLLFGGALGAIGGLFGGASDALVGRAIETVSAFPPLVLVLGIQAAVPHATTATLFFAIALTRWPEVARLVRAEVLQVATRDYVLAARALGASPLRVLRKHVAPNMRGQLIVLGALGVPAVILIEASIDFLRVGAVSGAASWGETMSEFRDASHAWWLLAFPGAFLFLTVVALNLVGEARRERLDPRER
jgi:peptide/nickel transport system permease protein